MPMYQSSNTAKEEFNRRKLIVNFTDNQQVDKQVVVRAIIQATLPLFVTDDDSFQRFVYKTTESIQQPTYRIKGYDETTKTTIDDRFIFITRVESYLNRDIVDMYYDKLYQDIIIVPDLVYAKHLSPTQDIVLFCQRIGSGYNIHENPGQGFTLSTDEANRKTLPAAKQVTASIHLAALPGLQTPNYTQDADSFEEMITDTINLKRFHRQMFNYVSFGTVGDLFGKAVKLPLYLLHQSGVRGFQFKYLNEVTPDTNTKLYIPLNF